MGEDVTAEPGDSLDPVDAFKIIGNETRLRILQELTKSRTRPVSFAELRKRVDLRDGSQFNYHLRKLEPAFVRKTDEGYTIRHAGLNVIRAVVAGHFTDHPQIAPFETGETCIRCAGTVVAWYEHEMVLVACSACDSIYSMGLFSPGGLRGRSREEVLTAFSRRIFHDISLALDGVCAICDGVLERELLLEGTGIDGDRDVVVQSIDDGTDHGHAVLYRCVQCDFWAAIPVGTHLRTHPAVVGFYWDHGIDVQEVPEWKLEWCLPFAGGVANGASGTSASLVTERAKPRDGGGRAGTPCTTLVAENPVVFEVLIELDDERLRVTLDDDLAVVEVAREQRTDTPTQSP